MSMSTRSSADDLASLGVHLQRIMVAYDFSVFAESAIAYARAFAKFFQAEVLLAHVEDISEEVEDSLTAMRAVHRQNVNDMELVAARLQHDGVVCTTLCRSGNPSDVLVQVTSEKKPDLLILGAYSKVTAQHERLGSTAEFIMRSVRCATLTIGPQAMLMGLPASRLHSILYASTFPETPGTPLRVAQAIAIVSGAEVEVAHVVERGAATRTAPSVSDLDAEGERMVARFRALGIPAHCRLLEGLAGNALADRAASTGAGLILFGIEHHAVAPSWAGAISHTVQRATCPVLSVPGPA